MPLHDVPGDCPLDEQSRETGIEQPGGYMQGIFPGDAARCDDLRQAQWRVKPPFHILECLAQFSQCGRDVGIPMLPQRLVRHPGRNDLSGRGGHGIIEDDRGTAGPICNSRGYRLQGLPIYIVRETQKEEGWVAKPVSAGLSSGDERHANMEDRIPDFTDQSSAKLHGTGGAGLAR